MVDFATDNFGGVVGRWRARDYNGDPAFRQPGGSFQLLIDGLEVPIKVIDAIP